MSTSIEKIVALFKANENKPDPGSVNNGLIFARDVAHILVEDGLVTGYKTRADANSESLSDLITLDGVDVYVPKED